MATSALGQPHHFGRRLAPSGVPRATDIPEVRRHVSKVPKTDDCAGPVKATSASRYFQPDFRILYPDIAALLTIRGERRRPEPAC